MMGMLGRTHNVPTNRGESVPAIEGHGSLIVLRDAKPDQIMPLASSVVHCGVHQLSRDPSAMKSRRDVELPELDRFPCRDSRMALSLEDEEPDDCPFGLGNVDEAFVRRQEGLEAARVGVIVRAAGFLPGGSFAGSL